VLKLDALDTVYFGTGKPFNKEGDNWTDSMFPPAPSVLYGALRTAYFADNISLFNKANTAEDPTLNLRLKGIFLISDTKPGTIYFPMPLDLVTLVGAEDQVFLLSLQENYFVSNCPTSMVLMLKENQLVETVEGGVIDHLSMADYLSGGKGGFPYHMLTEFITREMKVGIGIDDDKGTAQDTMLYRIGMIRPEIAERRGKGIRNRKLSLLVDYEGLQFPARGLIKAGGEGKAAEFEPCDEKMIALMRQMPIQWPAHGTKFKVYLATPAKFEKGWLPGWLDETTLEGTYQGIRLKLLTAAIGKPLPIGGYDMEARRPKPMMRAVPAGSVYYFEILDGTDLTEAIRKFHYENISDVDAGQGFGLAFAGGVQE